MTNDKTLAGMGITVSGDTENCRVRVDFGEALGVLELTPEEARALASQLIQTVYQTEVRASIKRNQARELPPAGRRVVEAPFPLNRPQPARQ